MRFAHGYIFTMIERNTVINEYRNILNSLGVKGDKLLDRLPPSLCRAIALQQYEILNTDSPFTGVDDEDIYWLNDSNERIGVYIGKKNLPVISELPLEGHAISGDTKSNLTYIKNALALLSSLSEDLIAYVEKWTSLIVWMERSPNFSGTLLTSSTFPNFPHCTFISSKSLQHIPPNNVLGFPSQYALAENLYHEALHQELAALLLHRDVLVESYHTNETVKIEVPWRGGAWEPDRVFHAIFVYSHLIPLRNRAITSLTLKPVEQEWLFKSIPEARMALSYLVNQMKNHLEIFQNEYGDFVSSILDKADNQLHEQA